ncbi:MAG: hypothetical protein EPO02_02735 [Nitrospirae bacterium]|nr:MAG: hypothetical protein EPO02_02735 [Nitrospirota bacterium]
MPDSEHIRHQRFIQALQYEPIACERAGCPGPVLVTDLSQFRDRVKSFDLACERCGWRDRVTGREASGPPWDDTALLDLAYEHLMHQQPVCPHDGTPVVFTSLPNPRRKGRYRLSCFYCGRQAEMDWPPSEAKS